MSAELEARPRYIPHPVTGEALDLEAPTETLAAAMQAVKEHEAHLRSFKRALSDELLERMDHEARWTWRGSGLKLSAPSPEAGGNYDAERLWFLLAELVDEGVISAGAKDSAVTRDYAYKTNLTGIKALARRRDPRVDAALAEAVKDEPKRRSVEVTRG